jgi:hypothetical protein
LEGARLRQCTAHWGTQTTALKAAATFDTKLNKTQPSNRAHIIYHIIKYYYKKTKPIGTQNSHNAATVATCYPPPKKSASACFCGGELFGAPGVKIGGLRYPQISI